MVQKVSNKDTTSSARVATSPTSSRFVISRQNMPAKLPIWPSAVLFLMYQHYPPVLLWQKFVYGLLAAWMILNWIIELYCVFHDKQVDIVRAVAVLEHKINTNTMIDRYDAILAKCKREIPGVGRRRRNG